MSTRALRWFAVLAISIFLFPSLTGCGANGAPPSTLVVELPDGTTTTVEAGSGVQSLAGTSWLFFRTAENLQAGAFATIVFGTDGNLEAFENNTLGSEIFGDEIIFDNTRRATKQFGLTYIAATYGAETADTTGFTFEGRLTAFAAGLTAGTGEATAIATFDENDPDTVRGTFRFKTEVTLIDIPGANQDDQFSFVGRRVVE